MEEIYPPVFTKYELVQFATRIIRVVKWMVGDKQVGALIKPRERPVSAKSDTDMDRFVWQMSSILKMYGSIYVQFAKCGWTSLEPHDRDLIDRNVLRARDWLLLTRPAEITYATKRNIELNELEMLAQHMIDELVGMCFSEFQLFEEIESLINALAAGIHMTLSASDFTGYAKNLCASKFIDLNALYRVHMLKLIDVSLNKCLPEPGLIQTQIVQQLKLHHGGNRIEDAASGTLEIPEATNH